MLWARSEKEIGQRVAAPGGVTGTEKLQEDWGGGSNMGKRIPIRW